MTTPSEVLQLSEDLGRSSIAENTSFSTREEEEKQQQQQQQQTKINKKKVTGKIYSRLAFNVKRIKRNDKDDESVGSMDSSLSSHDIFQSKTHVMIVDERKNRANLGRGKKIMKRVFDKKSSSAHDAFPVEDYPKKSGNLKLVERDIKKKATQRRYSKLAFSVQQVGTVTIKKNKRKKKKAQS
mmetsp:Transcript_4443/g.3112  ORF Transcript_4443/g.3112 Transcript_4443/m.3112 type:complete len:183 (-) Transcript_4443:172-720(-)